MKPINQTIFKPPHGNCLQAAIASIFELPLDKVPNFMERKSDWWDFYQRWLGQTFDVYSLRFDAGHYDAWLDGNKGPAEGYIINGYHLITGKSPRGDYNHVVVGYDRKPIFDPFPDGDCELIGEREYELFVKRFADDIFVSRCRDEVYEKPDWDSVRF